MKLAKDIALILGLAAVWFGTAYYAGEALLPTWGLQYGLVSPIAGLMGLWPWSIAAKKGDGSSTRGPVKTTSLAVSNC